jgi:hypothetical protein
MAKKASARPAKKSRPVTTPNPTPVASVPKTFLYYSDGHYYYRGVYCPAETPAGVIASSYPLWPLGCQPDSGETVHVGPVVVEDGASLLVESSGPKNVVGPEEFRGDYFVGTQCAAETGDAVDQADNTAVRRIFTRFRFVGGGTIAPRLRNCTFRLMWIEDDVGRVYFADVCRPLPTPPPPPNVLPQVRLQSARRSVRKGRPIEPEGNLMIVTARWGSGNNQTEAQVFVLLRDAYATESNSFRDGDGFGCAE